MGVLDGRRVLVVGASAGIGRAFAVHAAAEGARLVAVARRAALVRATNVEEHLPAMERAFGADFTREEDRYLARDAIAALLTPWFETHTLDEIRTSFDEHGVCWGPYQTFTQLLDDDWRVSEKNPVFADVDQPGIGSLRTPALPLRFPTDPPVAPLSAPLLGTHTDEVLADVLGMSSAEIGRLHDDGLVAGAA